MNLRTETETSGEDPDYAEFARPGESRNDPAEMRRSLEGWLATVLWRGSKPSVTSVEVPAANGMSNETVLFDATWIEDGIRAEHRLVARIAPRDSAGTDLSVVQPGPAVSGHERRRRSHIGAGPAGVLVREQPGRARR